MIYGSKAAGRFAPPKPPAVRSAEARSFSHQHPGANAFGFFVVRRVIDPPAFSAFGSGVCEKKIHTHTR
jgi:hypothetical protein